MTQRGAVQTGLGRRHSYMSEEPFCQPEALYCQVSLLLLQFLYWCVQMSIFSSALGVASDPNCPAGHPCLCTKGILNCEKKALSQVPAFTGSTAFKYHILMLGDNSIQSILANAFVYQVLMFQQYCSTTTKLSRSTRQLSLGLKTQLKFLTWQTIN